MYAVRRPWSIYVYVRREERWELCVRWVRWSGELDVGGGGEVEY